ncbi:hypothetical protein NKH18_14195 [Streptomyces sp. M10(2022)]
MRSPEFDTEFRKRALLTRDIGIGLLFVAGLLWAWCAVLLLTPYEAAKDTDGRYSKSCESRLFTDGSTANEGQWNGDYCQRERDWPEIVAVLGLSMPISLIGVAVFTNGSVSRRMSAHSQAMRELDKIAGTPEK